MTLLATLVEVSGRVAAASARSAKVEALAGCLRGLSGEALEIAVSFLSGEIRQGRIGIGFATLEASLQGSAATSPSLHLQDVDRYLEAVAAIRGAGATQRRAQALQALFARGTLAEQRFLCKLLLGELRQGALAGVMMEAIAAATALPLTELRRAAMYAHTLGAVARAAMERGLQGLRPFQLETMTPVAPMLAQSATDVEEALAILKGPVAFEWKLDGARIQVHKQGDRVRIYSRSLKEVTGAIPEIVAAAQALPAEELVLDGEAIALDPAGRPHPFQTTMRRFGRKLEVERLKAELPMQAFYFDCLRLNDTSLVDQPAHVRFAALSSVVPAEQLMPRQVIRSREEALAFYADALRHGHEGVMAKDLDAPYEAGNRGASWLKIKRAHTLDLVVLAAQWGHGRRTGKLSNLHLGALDPATGEFVMLGKTFKGLTDAMLDWQTRELLAREIRRDTSTVYVRPEIVVEVAFSDLQVSPRYPAGLALRLARIKTFRTDKRAEEADTMDTVRKLFEAQR